MSRKSEREAQIIAEEIVKAARDRGEEVGGDYGAGRLTRAQKKSQERIIPWTKGPTTTAGRIWRKLV